MGTWEDLNLTAAMLLLLLCYDRVAEVNSEKVPALFAFGDSLVDVGNNNFLKTIAKSNFFPYGIDYAGGHTGRFSNGKSSIDFIGDMLGIPSPPPFAAPSTIGSNILNGVNYASASSGILDESGQHYGERYSLSQQVLNFERTLSQYRAMMNETALNQYLAKSIVIMVTGSNDYINNYLLPGQYSSSYNYTTQEFGNLLVNNYALYSLGLRKFFIAGLGPLGCIPNQRAKAHPGTCMENVNQMVGFFNEGLMSMLDNLNKNHSDAIFLYGNTYGVFVNILDNPAAYSFSVVDRACCGIGRYQGEISCLPFQRPCLYREPFVFWDAFHPTQSAVYVFSWRAVNGPPSDCFPINIIQMVLM